MWGGFAHGVVRLLFGQLGAASTSRPLHEAWAGLGVAACFNDLDMGGRGGELHYMEVRHAGDTPLEGLV